MLKDIESAALLMASAAKEASLATEELRAFVDWTGKSQTILMERDQEMIETMQKASAAIQTELEGFRKRAQALLDSITSGAEELVAKDLNQLAQGGVVYLAEKRRTKKVKGAKNGK